MIFVKKYEKSGVQRMNICRNGRGNFQGFLREERLAPQTICPHEQKPLYVSVERIRFGKDAAGKESRRVESPDRKPHIKRKGLIQ